MAEHRVEVSQMPEVEIVNKDLRLKIFSAGQVYGELTISRGGLGWFLRGPSNERHVSWEKFNKLMSEST